jgi:hypothetical protein
LFTVDPAFCDIIKPILPLIKTANTSVSASKKHGTVQISQFNLDQQILFYHQINNQNVEDATKFSIASERLIALLHGRDCKIKLSHDGNALNYSSGRSKGLCETFQFEAYERPDIKTDRVLTGLVRKYFNLIALKPVVDNTECFLFIKEEAEHTHLIVTDNAGYHAVILKIKTPSKYTSQITIPLLYVQNAIRILKEDIQICSDDTSFYCYTKNKDTTSIIRFRNLLDTSGITSTIIEDAISSENMFSFETKADAFDAIIKEYKVVKDKDRAGSISVHVKDKRLQLKIETRHGNGESEIKIKDRIEVDFNLPIVLLEDCLRIKEGAVTMGLKKDHNIFFINQSHKDLDITYMLSADKSSNTNEER